MVLLGSHLAIGVVQVSVEARDDAHDVGAQLLACQLGDGGKAAQGQGLRQRVEGRGAGVGVGRA